MPLVVVEQLLARAELQDQVVQMPDLPKVLQVDLVVLQPRAVEPLVEMAVQVRSTPSLVCQSPTVAVAVAVFIPTQQLGFSAVSAVEVAVAVVAPQTKMPVLHMLVLLVALTPAVEVAVVLPETTVPIAVAQVALVL